METRGHYILIGAFVMSVVAAAFIMVLNLSNQRVEFDEYDIIFTERVSGLSVGAQVRFNGIQKGEVSTLTIDPDNPAVVVARIRVGKDTPVKPDTRAELEPVGFTGLTVIQLVGGSAGSPLLRDASDERIPKITADMSSFGVLFEGSGDVIAQASKLLSERNIVQISDTITNIEKITGAFADNEEELANIIDNTDRAVANIADLAETLNKTAVSLNQLISEDGASSAAELNLLLSDVRKLISENETSLQSFADEGLGQVAPALAEIRRLTRTLDQMLSEIDRDPRAYFLGEGEPEYSSDANE